MIGKISPLYIMNPQSVYNGLVSNQRNMFLTSSVAVAMIGFSNKFENKNVRFVMKFLSLMIFIISITIGLKSNYEFTYYLDNNEIEGAKVAIDSWRSSIYITIAYVCIIGAAALAFIINRIHL